MHTEKVDALIDTLCDYITELTVERSYDSGSDIAKVTKALVELIAAQAMMEE